MEGNLLPLSPLTPLEHPLSLYPFCVSSLLHPLSSPSYDSFGSDLLDDPFTTMPPPPIASTNPPRSSAYALVVFLLEFLILCKYIYIFFFIYFIEIRHKEIILVSNRLYFLINILESRLTDERLY